MWLFTRPVRQFRPAEIIGWWEARRVPYNAIVGVAGFVSSVVMITVGFTCERHGGAPIGLPGSPVFAIAGVLIYGIMANVCYTGGWVTELLVTKMWRVDTRLFGPIALTLGTAFSVLVTLVPSGLVIVVAAITSCRGF